MRERETESKLDKAFANELAKVGNGNGGREHRFALMEELKLCSDSLGDRYNFDIHVQGYGRIKVALCVAATILKQVHRHENPAITWAQSVMSLWTNRSDISKAIINIHPAILDGYFRKLRRFTEVSA